MSLLSSSVFIWAKHILSLMSYANHVDGFIFDDEKDSILAKDQMPNFFAMSFTLRSQRTARRKVFKAVHFFH